MHVIKMDILYSHMHVIKMDVHPYNLTTCTFDLKIWTFWANFSDVNTSVGRHLKLCLVYIKQPLMIFTYNSL